MCLFEQCGLKAITLLPYYKEKSHTWFSPQPGTLNQAIEDIKAVANQEEDGSVNSIWLMAE